MIEVNEIQKKFRLSKKRRAEVGVNSSEITVVDNISFRCKPGRIFTLLGPNGAGKTTTLRMIATIMKPTSGSIRVGGYDSINQAIEVRKRIGFLTGSTGLYERLSPDEMLSYFAKLYQVERGVFEDRRKALYDLLDMHHFASQKIGQLSTGMRQKVSIARTMIHDPDIVVFDEPTSGLDVITAKNIIQLIRDCKAKGKTVIFSSHIMSEVDLLCDDLAILHKGKLIFNDTLTAFHEQMQGSSLTEEFIRIINEESHA